MKRLLLLLIPVLLLMSSCFNVKEKIYIKDDGSGSYAFELDMSPTLDMMESMDKKKTDSLKDALIDQANKENEFAKLKGIRNAKNNFDRTASMYSSTFDFVNIDALQNAWKNGNHTFKPFDAAKLLNGFKTLSRSKNKYVLKLDLKDFRSSIEETKVEEIDLETKQTMMVDLKYIIELRFDKPLASFKGANLARGSDDKTLIFTMPLFDLLFDKKVSLIDLSFKLK